jgi:acetyl esterase
MEHFRTKGLRPDPGGLLVEWGLEGLARLAALHPTSRPERHGVAVTRDVAYGPGRHQRLDVYRPASGKGVPVLYLHGGGFRILSKETHWGMALAFARKGYTVFMPNYRLAPRHPFPAGLEDAAAALQWVWARAGDWQADPKQLVLAGESAGGNFAVALAVACAWEHPEPFARPLFEASMPIRAVLPACAMLQVSDPHHRGTPSRFVRERIAVIGRDYLPGVAARQRAGPALADVIDHLETAPAPARPLPPLFAICGDRDPIRLDTERLTPAWRRLGGQAEHRLYHGVGHAFHAFWWTHAGKAAWRDQFAFLDEVSAKIG